MNRTTLTLRLGLLPVMAFLCLNLSAKISDFDTARLQHFLQNDQAIYSYQVDKSHQNIQIEVLTGDQRLKKSIRLPTNFSSDLKAFHKAAQHFGLAQKSKREAFINQSNRLYQILWSSTEHLIHQKKKIFLNFFD